MYISSVISSSVSRIISSTARNVEKRETHSRLWQGRCPVALRVQSGPEGFTLNKTRPSANFDHNPFNLQLAICLQELCNYISIVSTCLNMSLETANMCLCPCRRASTCRIGRLANKRDLLHPLSSASLLLHQSFIGFIQAPNP